MFQQILPTSNIRNIWGTGRRIWLSRFMRSSHSVEKLGEKRNCSSPSFLMVHFLNIRTVIYLWRTFSLFLWSVQHFIFKCLYVHSSILALGKLLRVVKNCRSNRKIFINFPGSLVNIVFSVVYYKIYWLTIKHKMFIQNWALSMDLYTAKRILKTSPTILVPRCSLLPFCEHKVWSQNSFCTQRLGVSRVLQDWWLHLLILPSKRGHLQVTHTTNWGNVRRYSYRLYYIFEYQEMKPSNKRACTIFLEFHCVALSIVYMFHPTMFFQTYFFIHVWKNIVGWNM